jgi:glycosyltransferase involved in cell wall biosynthesis
VKTDRPVAVFTEYALLSKCLDALPDSILKVVDTVEVFFRNEARFQVAGLSAPYVCTPASEMAALQRADLLVAIQKNDAQALRDLFPGRPVITVPHTYPQGRPRAASPQPGTVLYVGSSNPFNVHGLQQFLAHAWEHILERVPDASLRVVGSVPPVPAVEDRRVVHVGRVSDDQLLVEYQTAHVVINPQVAGTGLKIKCVEALSAGCPLVTNPAGADGLEEGVGTAFLLAKDWQEFSADVVKLLTDSGLRQRLEGEARRFAARMFSEEATFSELERALTARRAVRHDG